MTDYFRLLEEPRRPWMEPEALKEKFLALSAQVHPDRVHVREASERTAAHDRYTDLNAAYQCLREPKSRLRHLLELERGTAPDELQQIPADLMEQFLEVGRVCREADALTAQKAGTTSPLLQVQMFQRSQEWVERIRRLQQILEDQRQRLLEELRRLNSDWERAELANQDQTPQLQHLEGIYRLFGFYGRWNQQLQERLVRLSF